MSITTAAVAGIVKKIVFPIIEDLFTSKRAADKIKAEIDLKLLDIDLAAVKGQVSILESEINGDKLQRNWRPHLMYLFMILLGFFAFVVPVINSWLLPFLNSFSWIDIPKLDTGDAWKEIPDPFWNLLTVGVGGYVVSRGAEKIFAPNENVSNGMIGAVQRRIAPVRRPPANQPAPAPTQRPSVAPYEPLPPATPTQGARPSVEPHPNVVAQYESREVPVR